jgi:ABC-2 type transport system ATP-binding protein
MTQQFAAPLGLTILSIAALTISACGASPNKPARLLGEGIDPPLPGAVRDGLSYRVEIPAADPNFNIVFQILEPQTFSGDQTYPLIMHSHGFGNARAPNHDFSEEVGNLDRLTANGYGALSIDMRGHGESGGLIRVHDPDGEIQDVLLVMDWAEQNLPWVTLAMDEDAGEENLLIGTVGASYGGAWQLLTQAIDPKKRIDAIVASNTWNDVSDALNTNGVLKSGWTSLLLGAGSNAGDGNNFDPYVTEVILDTTLTNQMSDEGVEFLRYHSFGYFCDPDSISVTTNGGVGTSPNTPQNLPTGVPALFSQGLRDTLFTLNQTLRNAECLRRVGSPDVRIMTYQSGHNTIFPGPGNIYQSPQATPADRNCGPLTLDDATHAFFDEHLLGMAGRLQAVMGSSDDICLSLDVNNAVVVDRAELIVGGTAFAFGDTAVIAGITAPVTAATGQYTAPAGGAVIAGVPTATITVSVPSGLDADSIVFIGIGHNRASGNGQGVWDTIDDLVIPIRGTGTHTIELSAVGEQLKEGDQIAVNLLGSFTTHVSSFTRDPLAATMVVSGTVNIPIMPQGTVVVSK